MNDIALARHLSQSKVIDPADLCPHGTRIADGCVKCNPPSAHDDPYDQWMPCIVYWYETD